MHKLLKELGFAPKVLVTDKLRSYLAAHPALGLWVRNDPGGRQNNRAETSESAQRFVSLHAADYTTFNLQRHLIFRPVLGFLRVEPGRRWQAASLVT